MPPDPTPRFSAAIALVFGVFAWGQFPLLCGFMFSSTRAGPANYGYSLLLGGMVALIGLVSGLRSLIRGPRGAMLIAGMLLNATFLAVAGLEPQWFEPNCYALFTPAI
jgi:hypothetical protein